jgi:hypothetical protein
MGCPVLLKEVIKGEIEVQKETLNEKYLGLPSDVGRSKGNAFRYLRDKVWKKVLGWLELHLSVGGKEILIKSVAQAIPTFSMSCFKLRRGLCEHIKGHFFWAYAYAQAGLWIMVGRKCSGKKPQETGSFYSFGLMEIWLIYC